MIVEKSIEMLINQGKILILGFGGENRQFLEWLVNCLQVDTKKIIIADRNPIDRLWLESINYGGVVIEGNNYLDSLKIPEISHVFKTPGIWSLLPEIEVFRKSRPYPSVHNSMVFFLQKYRENIIGINATKGKTTTSTLVKYIIQTEQYQNLYSQLHDGNRPIIHYCGNTVGISPYKFWTSINQPINPHEYFVIELSSFQLQDLGYDRISPAFAVSINYFIDHQDQHASPQEYWSAKDNLHQFQKPQDWYIANEQIKEHSSVTEFTQKNIFVSSDKVNQLVNGLNTPLLGQHGKMDTLLAILATMSINYSQNKISAEDLIAKSQDFIVQNPILLQNFVPVPHRLQKIQNLETEIELIIDKSRFNKKLIIEMYDDGAANEPDAAEAALRALTQSNSEFLWIIFSGIDKGGSLEGLSHSIIDLQEKERLFRVMYFGQVGKNILQRIYQITGATIQVIEEKMKEELPQYFISKKQIVDDFAKWINDKLEEANQVGNKEFIETIQKLEYLKLNITFSPSGSSFDEFKNYIERAKWFTDLIESLKI